MEYYVLAAERKDSKGHYLVYFERQSERGMIIRIFSILTIFLYLCVFFHLAFLSGLIALLILLFMLATINAQELAKGKYASSIPQKQKIVESQWHWPDTPAYQEAYKREETELAKIRKEINRCFLYLGIALVFAVALITFGMVYYSIHK